MIAAYTTDGVHLTKEGYAVMEKAAKAVIDEVLKQQKYYMEGKPLSMDTERFFI